MLHSRSRSARIARSLTVVALVVVAACGSDEGATVQPPAPIPIQPPEGMELVWSDEYDGDEIYRTKWTYDNGVWGWGNGEAQY